MLLRGEVKDADAFTDKARLLEIIRPIREAGGDVVLEKDEEHGVFEVVLQHPTNGHPREVRLGDSFVGSPEYKALYSAYEEFREVDKPPIVVVDGGETIAAQPRGAGRATSWPRASAASPSPATRASAR